MKSPEKIEQELDILYKQMNELDGLIYQLSRKISTVKTQREYIEGNTLLNGALESQSEVMSIIRTLSRQYWATIKEPTTPW